MERVLKKSVNLRHLEQTSSQPINHQKAFMNVGRLMQNCIFVCRKYFEHRIDVKHRGGPDRSPGDN